MSKFWLVKWEINQECDTPEEAAQLAWADMRAPDSIANYFLVQEQDDFMNLVGDPIAIDLTNNIDEIGAVYES